VLLASTPLSIQATTLISRLPRLVAQRPEPSTLYIYRYTPPPPLPKSPVHHNFSPVVQPSSSCVLARCRGILPLRRRRWCFSPAISSIAGEPSSSSPTSLLPSSPLGERRCWPSPASCCARVPLPCNCLTWPRPCTRGGVPAQLQSPAARPDSGVAQRAPPLPFEKCFSAACLRAVKGETKKPSPVDPPPPTCTTCRCRAAACGPFQAPQTPCVRLDGKRNYPWPTHMHIARHAPCFPCIRHAASQYNCAHTPQQGVYAPTILWSSEWLIYGQ
jgi:hypothetical protein